MLNRRNLIIAGAGIVALILIGVIGYFVWNAFFSPQEVSFHEPVDIVHDFYDPWLAAAISTSTDPYKEGLADYPYLGREVRSQIKKARGKGGIDPVICQTSLPEDVALRAVSMTEEKAEVLVTARKIHSSEQALVTLLPLYGGWYIDDIRCSPGEFGPEREFSFDQEGYLLKNVPAPLNAEHWHIIFEQNGQKGHYAPLFFGATSTCKDLFGGSETCSPDTFTEAAKVHVYGQMTELGVEVVRMELKR